MTPEDFFSQIFKGFNMDWKIIGSYSWQIIKNWWWVPAPFILWGPFQFLWRWWRHQDIWENLPPQQRILLEVKIPRESLKPIRAMENVFAALWTIYDVPNWKEKWFVGKDLVSFTCEIAGIGGEGAHFYIRPPAKFRNGVEAAIYSQYPEAEISLVDDYTKNVPQDIPNKDWNMWGCDYIMQRESAYPLRTYKHFEEEREAKVERRRDPISTLLEGMAQLQPGEQLWVQIRLLPLTDKEVPWVTEGKRIRDRLARRPEPKKPKSVATEFLESVTGGVSAPAPETREIIPPEMKLTPGEREIITALEEKIGKYGFLTWIRFIYLGKRDVYLGPKNRLAIGFFNSFNTQNLNTIKPWGKTLTKIMLLLRNRRLYLRKRRMFKKYVRRAWARILPLKGGSFILNTEELASIYHFPSRVAAPAPFVTRLEAKRGEAPPGLPTE